MGWDKERIFALRVWDFWGNILTEGLSLEWGVGGYFSLGGGGIGVTFLLGPAIGEPLIT